MSLDRTIEHGKEHRRPYYDARRFDRTCRNHGSCPWCRHNRTYHNTREEHSAREEQKETA